jgi:formate--tetrahydrofolate ligase
MPRKARISEVYELRVKPGCHIEIPADARKPKPKVDESYRAFRAYCKERGAEAVLAQGFAKGGDGMTDLAQAVLRVIEEGKSDFKPLYELDLSIKQKIETIAREIYRARDVAIPESVLAKLARFEQQGFGHVPVCIAKTQYSFSADPTAMGAPEGHVLPVRDVRLSAGAGFVVAVCGDVMTMPGLPKVPAAHVIRLGADGQIEGLS